MTARITMGKPYSQDLRERVIATVDSGTRVCAAARLFLVSVSYVSKVVDRRRTTGETTARVEKHPWRVHVKFKYDGTEVEQDAETDGEFFGLGYDSGAGRDTYIFPGFEADRHSPLVRPAIN